MNNKKNLKGEIVANTIIVGVFNTVLSITCQWSLRKKIDSETSVNLYHRSHIPNHIWRTFHQTTAEFTFFFSAYGKFFKIDCRLGQKPTLNKLKKKHPNHIMYFFLTTME
jgi:hypothetical protein